MGDPTLMDGRRLDSTRGGMAFFSRRVSGPGSDRYPNRRGGKARTLGAPGPAGVGTAKTAPAPRHERPSFPTTRFPAPLRISILTPRHPGLNPAILTYPLLR